MEETYAYFWVEGFDPPFSKITEILGLEPTEAWNKGDPWLPDKKRKQNSWAFYSPLPKTEIFLDAHIEALLDILEEREQALQKIASLYQFGINCVGYFTSPNPGFHLSTDLIKRCSVLSISLDFDLYCTGKDEE